MNVCLLTSSYLPKIGGRQLVVHNLAMALKMLGHNVIVVAPYQKSKFLGEHNYEIVRFGFKGAGKMKLTLIAMIIVLAYVILKNKIDVINPHNVYHAGSWAYAISKIFKNIPLVGTPHGDDIQIFNHLNYGVRLNPEADKIVRRNVNNFDYVTAISESINRELKAIIENDDMIRDVPNGVWTSLYQNEIDRGQIRKQYGIPTNSKVLISVGRNHPIKGFDVGVDALAKLTQTGCEASYVIVGRGMLPLREKAQILGVNSRLITPGELSVENVAALYQASDIYVSPSYIESFGLTTIEAMSSGLPCIVSKVAGNKDIVSTDFGCFVEPGNPEDLADTLENLLKKDKKIEQMGVAARHHSTKYDWLTIAQMYVDVYQKAIGEYALPNC